MKRSFATIVMLAVLAGAACSKDPETAKRELFDSGVAYAAAGQHAEAIIQYRSALQHDPRFGDARVKLAESYLAIGDRLNAAAEFVRAADILPDDTGLQVRAAAILLGQRDFDQAVARVDKVLAAHPDDIDALLIRAHGLAGLNRIEDALDDIDAAIEADPNRAGSYASRGAVQMVRGDRAQAEAAFRQAVDMDPTSVPARLALANFFLASERFDDAAAALQAAHALDPSDITTNRALAFYHVRRGHPAEAEPYLQTVAAASSDPAAQIGLAGYYLLLQRPDDARRILERVAEGTGSQAVLARLRLAAIDVAAGDLNSGRARVDEVLAAEPGHPQALLAQSDLWVAEGRLDEALTAVQQVIEQGNDSAQAQAALARIHLLRRETSDAEAAFARAIQLQPRLVVALVELAKLRLASGRLAEAGDLANRAVAAAPSSPDAQLMVARVAIARGDMARASPIVQALERERPQSASVATTRGLLELARRQPARARAAFERARTLDASAIEPIRLLTQIDLREQRPGAARARLTAALAEAPENIDLLILASDTAAATGNLADAERLARHAVDTNANALGAYVLLGRIYLRTNRLAEATAEFERLAARQPGSVSVLTTVGMLMEMQGRIEDARTQYERILQIDSAAPVAANNLAWIQAEHGGNLDVALQLARSAKARLPDQPEVNDTLGWILYKRGLFTQALGPLQEAVAGDQANATYHYHLGLAAASAGDRETARTSLNRALRLDANHPEADRIRETLATLSEGS